MSRKFQTFFALCSIFFTLQSILRAQIYEKLADESIGYLKASTFGKPDVAKRTNKIALAQVRVHYKIVTTKAVSGRENGAKVTVYLDGAMTDQDMQRLTDEFYAILQRKLAALGIESVDWKAIAGTEYFSDREIATAERNNINSDAGNGQAWVSYTAHNGPVFYRYSVDQTRMFGNELLAFGKLKKIAKMCETLDAEFASFDAVVDFTSIMLETETGSEWRQEGKYLKYNANCNIAAMMSVPQSYTLLVDRKLKFDQYGSTRPIGQRDYFSEKPYEDPSKAALKTKAIFGDTRFTFTPVVIAAKRELYLAAARRALELYADLFVTKLRVIRGQASTDTQAKTGPVDNKTMKDVVAEARKNNDTTPVTYNEFISEAQRAIQSRSFKLAVDYLTEAIKLRPEQYDLYLLRGATNLNELKEFKSAVADFTKAMELNKTDPTPLYNRATAYIHMSEWKKAIKDFDAFLAIKPDYAEAYLNRGIALLNVQKTDEAIENFNRGLQLAPRLPNLYRARAIAYKVKGNATLAQADELRAAQLLQGQ